MSEETGNDLKTEVKRDIAAALDPVIVKHDMGSIELAAYLASLASHLFRIHLSKGGKS